MGVDAVERAGEKVVGAGEQFVVNMSARSGWQRGNGHCSRSSEGRDWKSWIGCKKR